MIVFQVGLVLYFLLMPVVAIVLARRFTWAKFLGPVLISCGFGIIVANGPALLNLLFQQPVLVPSKEALAVMAKVAKLLTTITIPLAIPLLLFQSDMSDLRSQGRTALIAFTLAVVSVFLGTFLVFQYFGPLMGKEAGKQAGMLMSVYVGGTPNLVAVQRAVNASEQSFAVVYAATTFVSSFYLFFLLTLAKPLLSRVFRSHPTEEPFASGEELLEGGKPLTFLEKLMRGGVSLGAAALCVVVSAGVTYAVTGGVGSLGVILCITTLAIAGSFWRALREIPTHEPIGTFLILIFCVSAGTQMDVAKLVAKGSLFLTFTIVSVLVFLTIHYILNRIANVDTDTAIIMSVATMFGPPFVPAVAQAMNNKSVMLPGMTLGFLGYAVGTYLGIAVGLWL